MNLKVFIWKCIEMYSVRSYWQEVNKSPGYGFVLLDNKPLSEPMLTDKRDI